MEPEVRRSGRKIKSRVMKVNGFTVLRANNYSLEEGERSVFDQELGKQVEPAVAAQDPGTKRKAITPKPKAPPSQEQMARQAYREQVNRLRAEHNKQIDDDVVASRDRRTLFFAAMAPLLEPFLEPSVLAKILQGAADARSRGAALPPPPRMDFQPECVVGGEMREYQLKGLAYLVQSFDNGISALLADEMGLGKTLQTIAFLGYLKHCRGVNGAHLVVCPLSVMASWMSEFQRWCPTLRVIRLHTGDPKEQDRLRREILGNISAFDVIVTTYDMLQSNKMVLQQMIHWRYLILDEGHKVKNEDTLVSNAVRHVHRQATLLLTGTPLQNNLHELWVLLNHIYPDVFTTSAVFDRAFDLTHHMVDDVILEKAHKLLQKLSLRRIKSEVEATLPPKTETKIFCPLAPMQNFWYQKLLENEASLLANVEARGTGLDEEFRTVDEYRKLRNLLMQLRKCCNHPYMFPGAEDPDAPDEDIVQASGKMQVMDRLLTKLKAAGHRVVLFSQFTETLNIIGDYLDYRGHKFARLDGSTNRIQRMVDIMTFNRPNSDLFVFLLSTRAGGLGVNLQTADTLILFDSDWNPQVDMQAMARVHRIGQTKPVHVYRLVSGGTVEERIQLRAEKKLYLDQMVNRGSTAMAESLETLGAKEIMAMLKFGAQAIFRSQGAQLTDADIDVIIDRTRTGAPQLSTAGSGGLTNAEMTAADFDKAELPTEIAMFQGKDYRATKKAVLGNIAEEWAQANPRSDRHKSTLVKIGQHYVLKKNMYSMNEGEPSTFGRERAAGDRELAAVPKRTKQMAGRDYQHMDECLFCWNDGLLVMCDTCPASYHPDCIGVDERSLKKLMRWVCPHHACAVCSRKAQAVGGMLFRCEGCPLSFCEDHLPATADIVGHCKGFEDLGMRHPGQACYIRCSKPCADYMAYRYGDKDHWNPNGEPKEEEKEEEEPIPADVNGAHVPKKARSKTERTDGHGGSPSRFALPTAQGPTFSFAALSTIAGNAGDMTGKGGANASQKVPPGTGNGTLSTQGPAQAPPANGLQPSDNPTGASQPSDEVAGGSQPSEQGGAKTGGNLGGLEGVKQETVMGNLSAVAHGNGGLGFRPDRIGHGNLLQQPGATNSLTRALFHGGQVGGGFAPGAVTGQSPAAYDLPVSNNRAPFSLWAPGPSIVVPGSYHPVAAAPIAAGGGFQPGPTFGPMPIRLEAAVARKAYVMSSFEAAQGVGRRYVHGACLDTFHANVKRSNPVALSRCQAGVVPLSKAPGPLMPLPTNLPLAADVSTTSAKTPLQVLEVEPMEAVPAPMTSAPLPMRPAPLTSVPLGMTSAPVTSAPLPMTSATVTSAPTEGIVLPTACPASHVMEAAPVVMTSAQATAAAAEHWLADLVVESQVAPPPATGSALQYILDMEQSSEESDGMTKSSDEESDNANENSVGDSDDGSWMTDDVSADEEGGVSSLGASPPGIAGGAAAALDAHGILTTAEPGVAAPAGVAPGNGNIAENGNTTDYGNGSAANQSASVLDTTPREVPPAAVWPSRPVSAPCFRSTPVPQPVGGLQRGVYPLPTNTLQTTPLPSATKESPVSIPEATPAPVGRNASPSDEASVTPAPVALGCITPGTYGSLDTPMETDVSNEDGDVSKAGADVAKGRDGRRADLSPYGLLSWNSMT